MVDIIVMWFDIDPPLVFDVVIVAVSVGNGGAARRGQEGEQEGWRDKGGGEREEEDGEGHGAAGNAGPAAGQRGL